MKIRLFLGLAAMAVPVVSLAQDAGSYQCSHGDLQRRVEIVYETGGAMPCEVHYHKDTEAPGQPQVLWRANNEAGYCEAKTTEFIAKLEGWGWNCGTAAAAPDPEPVEADDTEALAPAEDSDS